MPQRLVDTHLFHTAGMYLLCMSGGVSGIYLGDVLVFLGAICFTIHILVIEKFSSTDSMKMSCIQFIVIAIISTFAMIFKENVTSAGIKAALVPILYAGLLSSGIAYTLQMVGQKLLLSSAFSYP